MFSLYRKKDWDTAFWNIIVTNILKEDNGLKISYSFVILITVNLCFTERSLSQI